MLSRSLAVARFHAGSGGRVAQRVFLSTWILVIAAVGMSPEPRRLLSDIAHGLAEAHAPAWGAGLVAALAWAASRVAVARMAPGLDGWMRHLPAAGATHRRAVWGAAILASAGVWAAAVLLVAATAVTERHARGLHPAPLRAAGALVAWVAAPACALPVRRRVARLLPLGALFAAVTAQPLALGAGVVALAGFDRVAGPLAEPRRWRVPWAPRIPLSARIAVRALGVREIRSAVLAAVPVAAAYAFAHNNALSAATVRAGDTLGLILAVTLAGATLAHALAVRRPSWPWARSLPETAARRVRHDALLGAALGAAVVLGGSLVLRDAAAAVRAAAGVPLLAVAVAAGVRCDPARRDAAARELRLLGSLAALASLSPWAPPLLLGAAWPVWRLAVRRDRHLRVADWDERQHEPEGDSVTGRVG